MRKASINYMFVYLIVCISSHPGPAASAPITEASPAAWALAITTSQDRRERTRLRQRHDFPEGQRGAEGIAAVRDPADRMAEGFDRRLWDVLVTPTTGRWLPFGMPPRRMYGTAMPDVRDGD